MQGTAAAGALVLGGGLLSAVRTVFQDVRQRGGAGGTGVAVMGVGSVAELEQVHD